MTDIVPTTGQTVAVPDDNSIVGLEDFNRGDLVTPRIGIVQKEALFEDPLTGTYHHELDVVVLGIIKQRVLFGTDPDAKAPLCKSHDFVSGRPQGKDYEGVRDGHMFPWKASRFVQADHLDLVLDCADCPLKEFGTHPTSKAPWCTEQHVYAVLMEIEPGQFELPALLTLQKTNIKPSRAYTTGFQTRRKPMFTVVTHMSLTLQKNGDVLYSTINLSQGADTSEAFHQEYAQNYRAIRDRITQPFSDDAIEDEPSTVTQVTVVQQAPVAATSTPADDDDIPWSS